MCVTDVDFASEVCEDTIHTKKTNAHWIWG